MSGRITTEPSIDVPVVLLQQVRTFTLLLAILAVGACASAASGPEEPAPRIPADRAAEMEAIYQARIERNRERFTEADVRFMTGMIPHHAQAIVMARLAPERAESRAVRVLASRIINAQEGEIGLMQQWLRDRGQPVPEVHIEGSTLHVDGPAHSMHMPGMLTHEQIRELERAEGTEFDRLFLTYMIQHHRGAVSMVRDLLGTDGAAQDPAVFRLASDIHVDQVTEIARMERMIAAMAAGLPVR